jgi:hypothetical protein
LRGHEDANGAMPAVNRRGRRRPGRGPFVRGDPHFGVVGQSTQAVLKLRVRRSGFPRLSAVPVGDELTLWERVREERARCSRESRNPGAVLMIFARLRHCAMNVLIRSIGTILTPFSVRKQPHRRMCSGLMPMPMKRPVR